MSLKKKLWLRRSQSLTELKRLTCIYEQWFSTPAEELEKYRHPGHTKINEQRISGGGTQVPVKWGGYSQTRML